MRKRHVIFDIGGVLLDFDLPGLVSRASRGNPESAAALRALRDHDSLRQLESGFMTGEAYFEQFIRPVAPHWTFRDLIEGWKAIFSENRNGLDLLRKVRAGGASVYLLSNLADFNRIAIEEQFPGLLALSDGNFLSYEMGCMKPDPAIFRSVLETIGALPGDCLFLDDTPGHVEGARRMGLNGLVFERGREARVAAEVERWIAGSGGPA